MTFDELDPQDIAPKQTISIELDAQEVITLASAMRMYLMIARQVNHDIPPFMIQCMKDITLKMEDARKKQR